MAKLLLLNKEGILNIDFIIGYITAYVGELPDPKLIFLLREKLENINNIKKDKIISENNVI